MAEIIKEGAVPVSETGQAKAQQPTEKSLCREAGILQRAAFGFYVGKVYLLDNPHLIFDGRIMKRFGGDYLAICRGKENTRKLSEEIILLKGHTVKVRGLENLPQDKRSLFAANYTESGRWGGKWGLIAISAAVSHGYRLQDEKAAKEADPRDNEVRWIIEREKAFASKLKRNGKPFWLPESVQRWSEETAQQLLDNTAGVYGCIQVGAAKDQVVQGKLSGVFVQQEPSDVLNKGSRVVGLFLKGVLAEDIPINPVTVYKKGKEITVDIHEAMERKDFGGTQSQKLIDEVLTRIGMPLPKEEDLGHYKEAILQRRIEQKPKSEPIQIFPNPLR